MGLTPLRTHITKVHQCCWKNYNRSEKATTKGLRGLTKGKWLGRTYVNQDTKTEILTGQVGRQRFGSNKGEQESCWWFKGRHQRHQEAYQRLLT